jgi:hypothetical protein
MTDMQPLIILSNQVMAEPTEEHLEAFLQAYNATRHPESQAEFVLYEVLGDMTLDAYIAPECDHDHADSTE